VALTVDYSNSTGGGWLAATSAALAFLPHSSVLDGLSSASLLNYFDASVAQNATPLARAQYEIQRSWISEGQIPDVEIIQVPAGTLNATAGQNYMTLMSGLMVSNCSFFTFFPYNNLRLSILSVEDQW
jgi:hypothetical protein